MSESIIQSINSYADRDGLIWFDGKFVPWREAKIHVLSHAIHYASAVFEGIRAYDGKPFELNQHSNRQLESAKILDLPLDNPDRAIVTLNAEQLNDICNEVLEANNLTYAYLRPLTWRGPEEMGVSALGAKVHTMVAAWTWPPYFSANLKLAQAKFRRPSPDSVPWQAKASSLYAICTLSKHEATMKGYGDALMLDHEGNIAEATGANIFFLKGSELHTPIPDSFLDGITRRCAISIAKDLGVTVIERKISPDELTSFSDCFVTGTAAEITPVAAIQQSETIGDDFAFSESDITRKIKQSYQDLVLSK